MTVTEALIASRKILEDIRIPAALAEDVALPIHAVIQNLRACIDALEGATAAEPPEEGSKNVRDQS